MIKRNFFLLFGLFLKISCLFSQNNPPKVYLELLNPVIQDDQFIYSIKITNCDTLSYTIFKPTSDEICNQTLQFYFVNKKTNKENKFHGMCTGVHQLSAVPLNEQNIIYLNPNESFIKEFRFPKEKIEFVFNLECFTFYAKYFLSDVHFISFYDNILKVDLTSNELELNPGDSILFKEK